LFCYFPFFNITLTYYFYFIFKNWKHLKLNFSRFLKYIVLNTIKIHFGNCTFKSNFDWNYPNNINWWESLLHECIQT
jgi:hypothetical protein